MYFDVELFLEVMIKLFEVIRKDLSWKTQVKIGALKVNKNEWSGSNCVVTTMEITDSPLTDNRSRQKVVKYLLKFELHVHVDTILSEIKKNNVRMQK